MPPDDTGLAGLKQQVYDAFLSLFHQSAGATAADTRTFLAFEPVGSPLTPGMFKLHAADPAFYAPLATEAFSTLANVVPALNADVFLPTDRGLEPIYEMLLLGAQCPPDSPVNALFDAVKSEAVQGFQEAKTPSLRGGWYRPAFAQPPDWYDPTVDANWTAFRSDSGTSTGPPPPPPNGGPRPRGPAWGWHVLLAEDRPILKDPEILRRMTFVAATPPDPGALAPDPAASPDATLVLDGPTRVSILSAVSRRAGLMASADSPSAPVSTPGVGEGRFLARDSFTGGASAQSLTARSAIADRAEISSSLSSDVTASTETATTATSGTATLSDSTMVALDPSVFGTLTSATEETAVAVEQPALAGAVLAGLVATTQPQPSTSQSLSVSMSYCLVTAHRPWLSQALFSTPGWSLPGFPAAGFSGDGNSGAVFPAIPIACLVIKDLRITADWSEISGVAQQSAAFGPFSLVGQTVDQASSSLLVSGMQVLGWVCQVMPALPPLDATP